MGRGLPRSTTRSNDGRNEISILYGDLIARAARVRVLGSRLGARDTPIQVVSSPIRKLFARPIPAYRSDELVVVAVGARSRTRRWPRQRARLTPPVFLKSFAGQGSQQRRPFAEAARPRFLVVQSFHDLGCDRVLLLWREGLNASKRSLKQTSHAFTIAQSAWWRSVAGLRTGEGARGYQRLTRLVIWAKVKAETRGVSP